MKNNLKITTLITMALLISSCGAGLNPITETKKPKSENSLEDFASPSPTNDAGVADEAKDSEAASDKSAEDGIGAAAGAAAGVAAGGALLELLRVCCRMQNFP